MQPITRPDWVRFWRSGRSPEAREAALRFYESLCQQDPELQALRTSATEILRHRFARRDLFSQAGLLIANLLQSFGLLTRLQQEDRDRLNVSSKSQRILNALNELVELLPDRIRKVEDAVSYLQEEGLLEESGSDRFSIRGWVAGESRSIFLEQDGVEDGMMLSAEEWKAEADALTALHAAALRTRDQRWSVPACKASDPRADWHWPAHLIACEIEAEFESKGLEAPARDSVGPLAKSVVDLLKLAGENREADAVRKALTGKWIEMQNSP